MRWLKFLKFLKDVRGTSALTSTQYDDYVTYKYPPDARDIGGRIVPMYLEYTIVAADTADGTVKLGVHPAGWRCVGGSFASTILGLTTTSTESPFVGDGSDADMYMLATDMDVAAVAQLASTAMGYTPTADMTITLTFAASTDPVAGGIFKGCLFFIPPS